jgi:hypothetical protein
VRLGELPSVAALSAAVGVLRGRIAMCALAHKTAISARRHQQGRRITQVLKVVVVSPVTDRRF